MRTPRTTPIHLGKAEGFIRIIRRAGVPVVFVTALLARQAFGASTSLQIVADLSQIKLVLSQIGPALSTVLFVLAGIFYATGQMLPPDKKAQFHTTAVNIVIGAIVVGALSFASASLATASTHLLSNFTATNNTIS